MHVAFVTDAIAVGGSAIYGQEVARALARDGHAVSLLTFGEGEGWPPVPGLERQHHVRLPRMNSLSVPARTRAAREFLRSAPPADVLLADHLWPGLGLWLAVRGHPRLGRVPRWFQHHGLCWLDGRTNARLQGLRERPWDTLQFAAWRGLARACMNRFDQVVTFSDFARRQVQGEGVVQPVHQVLPGRDEAIRPAEPAERRALRRSLGLDPDRTLLLVVSRLQPWKGVHHLVDLLGAHPSFLEDRTLVVAAPLGDEHGDTLLQRHARSGLGGRVLFFNGAPREQVRALFRAADAFLLPSVAHETFGLVALEALSAGTPVFAYRLGASPEHVEPWGLADLARPADLLDRVEAFLARPHEEREEIRRDAARRVLRYSWSEHARSLASLMEESLPAGLRERASRG